MKINNFFIIIFAWILLISTQAYAQKINVAVMELVSRAVAEVEAATITDELRAGIVNSGRFNVIERGRMNEILIEQGFQKTDICNTQECYVEMGQIIGVEQLIVGNIGRVGTIYTLSIRIIDVATGQIILQITDRYRGTIEDVLLSLLPSAVKKLDAAIAGTVPEKPEKKVEKKPKPKLKEPEKRISGTLALTCIIPDAQVYVDGNLVGTTPLKTVPLSGAQHKVVVKRIGYVTSSVDLSLLRDNQVKKITINLMPKTHTQALWRSAVVPGWGQLYQEQTTRGVVFGSIQAGLLLTYGLVLSAYSTKADQSNQLAIQYNEASVANVYTAYNQWQNAHNNAKKIKLYLYVTGSVFAASWLSNIADIYFRKSSENTQQSDGPHGKPKLDLSADIHQPDLKLVFSYEF